MQATFSPDGQQILTIYINEAILWAKNRQKLQHSHILPSSPKLRDREYYCYFVKFGRRWR